VTRKSKRLTVKRIERLRSVRGRHPDGNGLYLQVTDALVPSWLLRYQVSHRERWLGIGPLRLVGLAEARERARRAQLLILDGHDPINARRAERAARAVELAKQQEAVTFEAAARGYLAKHSPEWRGRRTAPSFVSRMKRYAWPTLGKLPVEAIDEKLVLKVIEPIWTTKTPTASRVREDIESVLDWAIARDLRPGPNPAVWRGNLAELLPDPSKVKQTTSHPAMPYKEVPAFVAELRERGGVAANALLLTIICATRTSETLKATWAEVDFERRVWTIPAHRMKSHREHTVPLSDAACELLRSLPVEEGNPHLFIGSRANAGDALASSAMLLLLKRMKRIDVTPHGFRSSFRTWAAERSAFPDHIAELCLAHTVGSAVERTYKRTDLLEMRRRLLQAWAGFCASTPAEGEVVPLRAAR
jgi:integrase